MGRGPTRTARIGADENAEVLILMKMPLDGPGAYVQDNGGEESDADKEIEVPIPIKIALDGGDA